jgi:hypothetical protein
LKLIIPDNANLNKKDRRTLRRAFDGLTKPGTIPEKRQRKLKDLLPEAHKPKKKPNVVVVRGKK